MEDEEENIFEKLTPEESTKLLEELFRDADEERARRQAVEEDICTEETELDRIFDLPENHQIMEDGSILYGARY